MVDRLTNWRHDCLAAGHKQPQSLPLLCYAFKFIVVATTAACVCYCWRPLRLFLFTAVSDACKHTHTYIYMYRDTCGAATVTIAAAVHSLCQCCCFTIVVVATFDIFLGNNNSMTKLACFVCVRDLWFTLIIINAKGVTLMGGNCCQRQMLDESK